MFTTNNGHAPGASTPIKNDEGTADGQVNNPQKATNNSTEFNSKLIAAYNCIKATANGIYLDRGIGADTLLMIALALIYGYARVTA